MSPFQFILDGIGMLKEIFGFVNKKTDLNNTPEMKKRAEAQKENNADDQDAKNIRNRDVDSTRNALS